MGLARSIYRKLERLELEIKTTPVQRLQRVADRFKLNPIKQCARHDRGRCCFCGLPITIGQMYRSRGDLETHDVCVTVFEQKEPDADPS